MAATAQTEEEVEAWAPTDLESDPEREAKLMAATAKTVDHEKPKLAEDWTIVLPRRRGKQKRDFQKIIVSEISKQVEAWAPTDLESDPEREAKLMHVMQMKILKLGNSQFYEALLNQIETPEVASQFLRVLGSEDKMQMVIYGIGSIESFESPRLQLSLAILLKRKFSWIGDIEVFDPIISLTESKVLAAFGCSVMSVNEQGRRQASKPTLFFMPHCDAVLYDSLLQANWRAEMLNQIVLFGNSFKEYERITSFCKNTTFWELQKHICSIGRFTKEFGIETVSDYYFQAFHCSSWHFFSLDAEPDLQVVKL